MITFQGTYFDGKSSTANSVVVTFDGVFLKIVGADESVITKAPLRQCSINPPLGKAARTIRLPDGSLCESEDRSSISELERVAHRNAVMRVVDSLESRWKMVTGAVLGLVVCVALLIIYGIPFLADKVARSIPPEVSEELSRQTMNIMDDNFLLPSTIAPDAMENMRKAFRGLYEDIGSNHNYRLEFRKSSVFGPNAFALPSGLIIVTDELVEQVEEEKELMGVLLHEIAHVENRHGLRTVIQNAGVFILISALVGDVTSITSAAASLPTILTRSGYSRKFEREADRYAALYFIGKGWPVEPYQNILNRITKDAPGNPGESWFSTHPPARERVAYLQELEASPAGDR